MRFASMSLLLLSTVGLAACGGAGSTLIEMNNSCGILCAKTNYIPPAPTTNTNGQAVPPPSTTNTGNTTQLTTGDTTIILEKGVLMNTRDVPAMSTLTPDTGTTEATKTAKISIDTKDPTRNPSWPAPKNMAWSKFGSQHELTSQLNTDLSDPFVRRNGRTVPSTLYDLADPSTSGSSHLGGEYNEYRAYSQDQAVPYDESLQIWTWGKSYAAQYRDVTSGGGTAGHQAWVFGSANGGTKSTSAELPPAGSLSFRGKYTSTVETKNFDEQDVVAFQTMTENGVWSSTGDANMKVTFSGATAQVEGTLDPDLWRKYRDADSHKGFGYIDVDAAQAMELDLRTNPRPILIPQPGDPIDPDKFTLDQAENYTNYMVNREFLDVPILLSGTLTATATGNTITGQTSIGQNQGWVTNTNTNLLYGSVFGTAATGYEVTGVFNVEGTIPSPIGGNIAINDDRRAFVNHSGIFHVEPCAPSGTPTCP
jgi:hypothetical protein